MWIFYYCMHGPGHQGTDSGYIHFEDDASKEYIREHVDNICYDWDDPVFRYWKVEKPSAKYTNREIDTARERIKRLTEYAQMLEKTRCFIPNEIEEEKDAVLQKNISGKVIRDVLRRLHRAGFMYDDEDISYWRWGKKCLAEPERTKILRIIRRSKSYPSMNSQLKRK